MILTTLVAAVAFGIAAQILAERFRIAAILPLLIFGVIFGPEGLKLFDPHALGDVLEVFIHLGVAIILFEGGLTLDPSRLREVGAPVRNLLTVGVVVTGLGAAGLAHIVLGLPWHVAALFGAIMTVTGPTVIVPLLRHMIAPKEVKTVLLSEGLIIDPIGAVLAYFALQLAGRSDVPWRELSTEILTLAATGAILGFAAGAMAKLVVRSRLVSGELRNLTILALLMGCYLVAEEQAPQSGILAAVVMGFTMSAAELPDLVSVKAFKGQLTILIISSLFILLAAQLELKSIVDLGWPGVGVVTAMILLVRPLSVLASVWPSQLDWRERLILAMTAPRGIVAAAVASLATHSLGETGIAGAREMEGLVYLAIVVTGAWSTLMAVLLPRFLGYANDPSRRRAVLVGANALSETIATMLAANGRKTVVVDGVGWRLERFRDLGFLTVCNDARDTATYEEAGLESDSTVVCLTTNDELNLLVAELVHSEFGIEHPVVAQQRPPEEMGRLSRAWIDMLGSRARNIPNWIKQMENGKVEIIAFDVSHGERRLLLRDIEREHERSVFRLAAMHDGDLSFDVDDEALKHASTIMLAVAHGRALDLIRKHLPATEIDDDGPVTDTPGT